MMKTNHDLSAVCLIKPDITLAIITYHTVVILTSNYDDYDDIDYRFGFNGMEGDDEVKGTGNSIDFGARIYDPRLGRFLSIDAYYQEFPSVSPFSFADNSPIFYIDANGNFRLHRKTQKQYPMLTNLLKNMETIVKSNPDVYEAFKNSFNLTDKEATKVLKWKKGPNIFMETIEKSKDGLGFGFYEDGNIVLNIKMVKVAEGKEQSKIVNQEEAIILTFITVLEEGQEYAIDIIKGINYDEKFDGDLGARFGKEAFGKEHHTGNIQDFKVNFIELFKDIIKGAKNPPPKENEVDSSKK